MLEDYFEKPDTIDRIRDCWLGEAIEQYADSLLKRGYKERNIHRRVPLLRQFAEFTWAKGARQQDDLVALINPFVDYWLEKGDHNRSTKRSRELANEVRSPVEQLLESILPTFVRRGRLRVTQDPFIEEAGNFYGYLREERGLRETSITHYGHCLRLFEGYLARTGVRKLNELSPAILSAFVIEADRSLSKSSMTGVCSSLRVFLRYIHRERLVNRDLAATVGSVQRYRLANLPRSISWDEVRQMLEAVDRRTAVGKRDYAILLLLVTYGLRAKEVAALTLDDVDWKRERLLVPERKAGHCTAYPFSAVVGEALLNYLKHVRPETVQRQLTIIKPPALPVDIYSKLFVFYQIWIVLSGKALIF